MDGFYIKRLTVSNQKNTESAEIKFDKGLTIVVGGSNIGKTFIYQCIDYMLGASKRPKRIKESTNYTKCELEIQPYVKGSNSHILKRKLDGGNFILDENETLYLDNNNKKNRTISEFLLDLTKMKDKKIRIDDSGQTRDLYFQKLKKYFLLDEDTIIVKKSNITGYTLEEKNTFNYIVTGKDDNGLNPTLSKSEIVYSETEIKTFEGLIEEIDREIDDFDSLDLFDKKKELNEFSSTIESSKLELEEVQTEIIEQNIMTRKYKNKCFCSIHNEEMICLKCKDENIEVKIDFSKLNELRTKKEKLKKDLEKKEKDYFLLLEKSNQIEVLKRRRKKYQDKVKNNKSNIQKDKYKKAKIQYSKIQSTDIEPISKIMGKILKGMKFKDEVTVEYSVEYFDFIINGQERELFGQGYSAIIYAVFIISILKFLENKPYQVGFSIIDSPLNPYKMKDNSDINLADNFYKYLDNDKSINTQQVIIFENTDVPHNFKSNVKKLKKGFFPISDISNVHLSPRNPSLL